MIWWDKKKPSLQVSSAAAPGASITSERREDCYFCQREWDVVHFVVAGPRASICEECIGLCAEIAYERAPKCSFCGTAGIPVSRKDAAAICSECAGRVVDELPPPTPAPPTEP